MALKENEITDWVLRYPAPFWNPDTARALRKLYFVPNDDNISFFTIDKKD